jgi:hypothetical protein
VSQDGLNIRIRSLLKRMEYQLTDLKLRFLDSKGGWPGVAELDLRLRWLIEYPG